MSDSIFDFRLPDVGEGLEEAEIVQWKVSVGQKIQANQPMVEIESSKSLVELPSPYDGIVHEILEPEGKIVRVGVPIIRIAVAESKPSADNELVTARIEMLVGSGPRAEENQGRPRKQRNYRSTEPVIASSLTPAPTKPSAPGLASPLVRKMARELGVDISTMIGSGPEGSVTREDVQRSVAAVSGISKVDTRRFEARSESAREVRTPIRGVQKVMAEAMVTSAFSAPHVTEFKTVDVTASMDMLKRLHQQSEFAGIRLSPLTLLARAMCVATWQTPQINSFWDEASHEIVTKNYVNLGIATATERGLIVPNIKDADQLSFKELARAIAELVETARTGKTEPKALTGGTISITNIGVFGIDSGTPILPPGESAIIALGAVAQRPWVVAGEIVIRQITTLALSFDHRLVDGAQGSRFLSDVALILQEPAHIAWV